MLKQLVKKWIMLHKFIKIKYIYLNKLCEEKIYYFNDI